MNSAIRSGVNHVIHSPHQWWRGGLNDPATYPLIVIVGFTAVFAAGMTTHAARTYKDVRFNPYKRHEVMRSWGTDERPTLVSRWVGGNAYGKEGLGVNHDEWKREHNKSYVERWLEEHQGQ